MDLQQVIYEYLELDRFPLEVIEKAKMCILDWIGVSLAATKTPLGQKMLQFAQSSKSDPKCSLVGNTYKTGSTTAAFHNATLGHILELDDTHMRGIVHPGTVIIPSVLSIGEEVNANPIEILTSIIVGYEVMIKLAISMQPFLRHKGFHATSVCGSIGSAAAIAKLLDLDPDKAKSALSIAATQSSGLLASFMAEDSEVKPIHAGFAARNGVFAVKLAQYQVSAPNVFKGYKNFYEVFSGHSHREPQMREFEILNVGFKIHSSCRHFHSAIDALISLMKENNLNADDITRIRVKSYSMAIEGHVILNPVTPTDIKMSLPFTLAIAAYEGMVTEEIHQRALADISLYNKLKKLAEKIEVIQDRELDKLFPEKIPAIVEVLAHGKKFEKYVEYPKGEPQNPLGWRDLVEKSERLTKDILNKEKLSHLVKYITTFEKHNSIEPLIQIITGGEFGECK